MNIKSRYAILLIIIGSLAVVLGSALKSHQNPYANTLFIFGLSLSFVGAIVFVINMYHKR